MNNEHVSDLLFKYITGQCSEEEEKEVEARLKRDPKLKEQVRELRHSWMELGSVSIDQDEDRAWKTLSERLDFASRKKKKILQKQLKPNVKYLSHNRHPSPLKLFMRVAAVLLIFGGLSFFYFAQNNSWFDQNQEITSADVKPKHVTAQKGQQVKLLLSDGTRVMLNAESTLEYKPGFEDHIREVHLQGEAFFEVTPDEEKPFIVHTGHASVAVMGTAFNVNAYPSEDQVRVAVTEGKVALRNKIKPQDSGKKSGDTLDAQGSSDIAQEVILTAGMISYATKDGKLSRPQKVDLKVYTAWLNGRMIFDHTPLAEVSRKLERFYDVQFLFEDERLKSLELTADLKQGSLNRVLDIISYSLKIRYQKDGRQIRWVKERNGE